MTPEETPFGDSERNRQDVHEALEVMRALASALSCHADEMVAEAGRTICGRIQTMRMLAQGYPRRPGDLCDRCGHLHLPEGTEQR